MKVNRPKESTPSNSHSTNPFFSKKSQEPFFSQHPKLVERQLNQTEGKGQSLPDDVKSTMGNAFNTDFSSVKIHTDQTAIQLTKKLGAKAFTRGKDIYFNKGEYQTSTNQGKKLLAHELTHVVQQKGSHQLINRQEADERQRPSREELQELNDAFDQAMGNTGSRRIQHLQAQQDYFRQLLQLVQERYPIENRRLLMDQFSLLQFDAESDLMKTVNRNALRIHVTPVSIEMEINLEVYFANGDTADYATLARNLRIGLSRIWGRRLSRLPSLVSNRSFQLIPNIRLSHSSETSDDAFQILVSPSRNRAETINNVMNIAPSDINNPDTLGHESLHLLGLADRYVDLLNNETGEVQSASARGIGPVEAHNNRRSGRTSNSTGVTRDDPLDMGTGAILHEDLDSVFANVGIYEQVIMSNLTPEQNVLIRRMGRGYIRSIPELTEEANTSRHLYPNLEHYQIMRRLINDRIRRIEVELSSISDREQLREDTAFDVD